MHTAFRKLSLLHLTDLHFGLKKSRGHYWNSEATELKLSLADRRGLLGSLVDDLKREKHQPDVVLITGDLLDRGEKKGSGPVCDFLGKLTDELGLSRIRIVLIPGNHDVLRGPKAEQYAAFDEIQKRFYGRLRPVFSASTKPTHRVERFDYADALGLEVMAFNSCEKLNPPKQEHGSVGPEQRRRAEELLAPTEGKGLFRVALMHHHLAKPTGVLRTDLSVMDDDGAVRDWLVRHRFQLVLHGHHHVDWQEIREIDKWFLSICAGGSAGVGNYGRKEWDLRLGYQVIVIDSPTSGKRFRREYDPQTKEWITAGRGEAAPVLRFGSSTLLEQQSGFPGQSPTVASLRKLIGAALNTDTHFTAFCDHFPDVSHEFTVGMSRTDKETLLLRMRKPTEILTRLREHCPGKVAENEALLKYG